jgi:hypothetical protein
MVPSRPPFFEPRAHATSHEVTRAAKWLIAGKQFRK